MCPPQFGVWNFDASACATDAREAQSKRSRPFANINWGIGVFALPVLIVIGLVGMAMTHQGASDWLSEAVQAEFVRTGSPDVAPTQLALPAGEMRAAKAN